MTILRMTSSTAAVLQALAAGYRYGFEIAEATGLRGGTVYPLLRRLESGGLLAGHWEDPELSQTSGRPARRYYELLSSARPCVEQARQRFPMHLAELGVSASESGVQA